MYRERVNEKLPTEYLLHEFDELISSVMPSSVSAAVPAWTVMLTPRSNGLQ